MWYLSVACTLTHFDMTISELVALIFFISYIEKVLSYDWFTFLVECLKIRVPGNVTLSLRVDSLFHFNVSSDVCQVSVMDIMAVLFLESHKW